MLANARGALTVTERGAVPALPTRDAVLDFLPKDSEQPQCFRVIEQLSRFQGVLKQSYPLVASYIAGDWKWVQRAKLQIAG